MSSQSKTRSIRDEFPRWDVLNSQRPSNSYHRHNSSKLAPIAMPEDDHMPERRREPRRTEGHREVLNILHEICTLLDIDLTHTQLAICTSLIEEGVNPEALATVVKVLMDEHPKDEGRSNG